MAVTNYEIDVDECRAILKDVQTIKDDCETFKDLEATVQMVDGHLYSTPELQNTHPEASALDRELYDFYEDKLVKTYDAVLKELGACISAMSLAVDAYADGDIAMTGDGRKAVPGPQNTPGGKAGVPSATPAPSRLPDSQGAVRYDSPYSAEYAEKKAAG